MPDARVGVRLRGDGILVSMRGNRSLGVLLDRLWLRAGRVEDDRRFRISSSLIRTSQVPAAAFEEERVKEGGFCMNPNIVWRDDPQTTANGVFFACHL